MKANWVVVLMPPFLVCMTLLFGTQFVFLQLGFFRDLGIDFLYRAGGRRV